MLVGWKGSVEKVVDVWSRVGNISPLLFYNESDRL